MPKATAILDPVGHKLLKYLPGNGVLICRSCMFAIQPSALSSHLLRHQIYRSERRQLLERLKKLDLREPEQVTYPIASEPALPDLPVYRGWICGVTDCGHACASEKRMAQHWSDQHGSRDVLARTAWLQTFFRGNKIRYFEVGEPNSAPTPITDDEEPTEQVVESMTLPPPPASVSPATRQLSISSDEESIAKPTYSSKLPPSQLNMLNLQLMHHWTTTTSLTAHRGTEPPEFWAKTILTESFSTYDFITYACLSAAAFHLASLNRSSNNFYKYREIALEYQGTGLTLLRKTLETSPTGKAAEACLAFNRLLGVTRCAEHHLDPFSVDSAIRPDLEGISLPVLECVVLLRNATEFLYSLQDQMPPNSGLKLPATVLKGLEKVPFEHAIIQGWYPAQSAPEFKNIPVSLWTKLMTLPPKLMPLIASSDEPHVVHAWHCVLTCFDRSYDPMPLYPSAPVWNAVEGFPRIITDRFLGLVEACHPASLVLLSLWAVMVGRLEHSHGGELWFLQGETERLFRLIGEALERMGCFGMKDLVADVEEWVL